METKVSIEVSVTGISPAIREVASGGGAFTILSEETISLGEIQALIDALIIVRDATSTVAAGDDTRVTLIDCDGHEWRPVPGDLRKYQLNVDAVIRDIEHIRGAYSPLTRADNGEPFA